MRRSVTVQSADLRQTLLAFQCDNFTVDHDVSFFVGIEFWRTDSNRIRHLCFIAPSNTTFDHNSSSFGSLKVEQVFGKQYYSRSAARKEIIDYIEMFYNSRRRHSYLGYLSPLDFENQQVWKKAA